MGPGEVFVDTRLPDLVDEIEGMKRDVAAAER